MGKIDLWTRLFGSRKILTVRDSYLGQRIILEDVFGIFNTIPSGLNTKRFVPVKRIFVNENSEWYEIGKDNIYYITGGEHENLCDIIMFERRKITFKNLKKSFLK